MNKQVYLNGLYTRKELIMIIIKSTIRRILGKRELFISHNQ